MKRLGIAALVIGVWANSAIAEDIDLSGFYLGAVAGFGSSNKLDQNRQDDEYLNPFPGFTPFRHSSPALGLSAGYNVMSGNTLIGIQLDVTGDLHETSRSYSMPGFSAPFPRKVYSGTNWFSEPRPAGAVETYYYDNGTTLQEKRPFYKFREQIAPTISARIGHQIGDALLYARVGGGISRLQETFGINDSNSIYCSRTKTETRYFDNDQYENWYVACEGQFHGQISERSRTITRPTATLAVGAEYHFDRYFTRLEAEMRHTFLDEKLDFGPANGLTQYRVNTGIGIRF